MRPGITITSSAPPAPENAVPSSVIGQLGPMQNSTTPPARHAAEMVSTCRRPTRSTSFTPKTPANSRPMPNVLPCNAATTPLMPNSSRSSLSTTPTLSPATRRQ